MRFSIQTISDKLIWEHFNLSYQYASIFQSWNYGEAQRKIGEKIERLGFYIKNQIIGIAQVTHVHARRGAFLHIRGGPVFKNWIDYIGCFPLIRHYALEKKYSFIRNSPPILAMDKKNSSIFNQLGFRDVPIPLLDAEVSWILDLNKTEDQLLGGMRKTTRYLIKKAQKLGVKVIQSNKIKAAEDLLNIYKIMTKEKGIVPHKGIVEEFKEFIKDDQAVIFLAHYKNRLLGAALILFYGNEGIYHHSAHLRSEENVPISYLIQWEAIKEAKRRGKQIYNFWGIEPTGNPKHPWAGLTLFKKGFGGSQRHFIRAQDYPLSSKYRFTWIIETLRKVVKYKTFI